MKKFAHRFSNIKTPIEFSIGCNARENDTIIDLADKNDIWFHVQDHPSCHVIASIPKEMTKKQIITIVKMGSNLCVNHTNKLKKEKKLVVIYTTVKHLQKTNVLGTVNASELKSIQV